MKNQMASFLKKFAGDETGAIMTEYIVMLTFLVVAVIWLNKVSDTILFGQSPYITPTNSQVDADALIPPDEMFGEHGPQPGELQDEIDVMTTIGGNTPAMESANPDKAYLSQVYIHLSRP